MAEITTKKNILVWIAFDIIKLILIHIEKDGIWTFRFIF